VSTLCLVLLALAASAQCPPGQLVSDDTQGHCCWANQVWSAASHTCRGIPVCPAGFATEKESCVAPVISPPSRPVSSPVEHPPAPVAKPKPQGTSCVASELPEWKDANAKEKKALLDRCRQPKPEEPSPDWPTPPPLERPLPRGAKCVASELPEWKDANARENKELLKRCAAPAEELPPAP
jgi:hypothetical protein